MKDEFVFVGITIRKDQKEFIDAERGEGMFIFSKFVQRKLDEYKKLKEKLQEMKRGIEDETKVN